MRIAPIVIIEKKQDVHITTERGGVSSDGPVDPNGLHARGKNVALHRPCRTESHLYTEPPSAPANARPASDSTTMSLRIRVRSEALTAGVLVAKVIALKRR